MSLTLSVIVFNTLFTCLQETTTLRSGCLVIHGRKGNETFLLGALVALVCIGCIRCTGWAWRPAQACIGWARAQPGPTMVSVGSARRRSLGFILAACLPTAFVSLVSFVKHQILCLFSAWLTWAEY